MTLCVYYCVRCSDVAALIQAVSEAYEILSDGTMWQIRC